MTRHRIQAEKLTRAYFLDLHYRMRRMEAARIRGDTPQLPPRYLYGQLIRALWAAVRQGWLKGREASLRREMNVAYFLGQMVGWRVG